MQEIDYHFKLLNKDCDKNTTYHDYGLNLFLGVSHRMFKMIFDKSIQELRKKKKNTPDEILEDKFNVPERFYKTLKTSITKQFIQIKREVAKDDIIIIDWDVKGGIFEKTGDVWIITILVKGRCRDDRKE